MAECSASFGVLRPLPPARARLCCVRACSLSRLPSDAASPPSPTRSAPRPPRALLCTRARPALAPHDATCAMPFGGPVGQSLQAGRRQGTGRIPAPCTLSTTSLECWPTEAGRATPPAHCCLFWLHAVLLRERRARGAAAMRAHVMRAHDRVPSPPRRYPHGANGGSQAGGTHGTGGVRRQWQAAAGRRQAATASGDAPGGSAPAAARHVAARRATRQRALAACVLMLLC